MRVLISIFLSFTICLGIFFGMHLMTSSDNIASQKKSETRHLVYLRDKNETNIEKKKRVKPKEPPKQEPVKKIKVVNNIKPKVEQKMMIKPLDMNIPRDLNLSAISSLSGAQIAPAGFLDANSLQAVRRVNPEYPRRAQMRKQEGFVELAFDISQNGDVSNIRVLKSSPEGVFDKSATKAMSRWKFKKHEDVRTASIKLIFRLAK